jgi:hypothetical protein
MQECMIDFLNLRRRSDQSTQEESRIHDDNGEYDFHHGINCRFLVGFKGPGYRSLCNAHCRSVGLVVLAQRLSHPVAEFDLFSGEVRISVVSQTP